MANKLKEWLRNPSVRYMVLSMAASGVNMLTLILYGRVFEVETYGVVSALQAAVANIAILMTPLQVMLCRNIAGQKADAAEQHDMILTLVIGMNILEAAVMAAAAVPVMRYLHLAQGLDYLLFVLLVISNNVFLIMNGAAQGRQRFLPLGFASLALYSVKMAVSILLARAGLREDAVQIGFIAGEAAGIAILVYFLGRKLRKRGQSFRFRTGAAVTGEYLQILLVYFVVSLYMNNGDLLLGNLYTPEREIGLYSVAATLSKLSVFLIATPLATLLLPRVAALDGRPAEQRSILAFYEKITLGLSAASGILLSVLAGWLIPLLYGESYREAAGYMTACAVFAAILSGFWVFYQYTMATALEKAFKISAGALGLATVAAVLLIRPGIGIIPLILAGGMAGTAALTLLLYRGEGEAVRGTGRRKDAGRP